MRVLNVAYPFAPVRQDTAGGAEQVVSMLDRALCAAGHRSFVLACQGSCVTGELIAASLPPRAVDGELDPDTRTRVRHEYRTALVRTIHRCRPDLIHLHGIDFADYLPPEGVPAVATLHLPPAWYDARTFSIARPRTWLHCVSRSQQQACPTAANLLPFIANGVPAGLRRDNVRKRGFALALGRICPEKGFHLAFDAAKSAGIAFVLAGQVFGYAEHLLYFKEQIVPRCSARSRFIGAADLRRKRRLLTSARCLLIPSLAPETSSLVAMEAAMCGTPVIAFRAGALPEIVRDGVTGFLVDGVSDMARAIGDCGRIDPAVCRATALAHFPEERTTASYLRMYGRLIDEN